MTSENADCGSNQDSEDSGRGGKHDLLEDCEECDWSEVWDGGFESRDPALQHAYETGHTVRTEVYDGE